MNQPNPLLKKLGLADDERVIIFHADDIGSFHSSVAAYREIVDVGLISAASVMVPCAWFPAVAAFCRENQAHQYLDMGVHLTLTCEWSASRWGSVAPLDQSSGLFDEEGYLHRTSEAVQEAADVEDVKSELRAQVERALDAHMGTLFHPRFLQLYIDLGLEFDVPPLIFRKHDLDFFEFGFTPEQTADFQKRLAELEAQGSPLLDDAVMLPLNRPQDRDAQFLQILDELAPGVTYVICHPSKDTPELREVSPPVDWPSRVADYKLGLDSTMRDAARQRGIHIIGYRVLRDLMRQSMGD